MPFSVNMESDSWQLVGSANSSPIENIIELIWCRLNFYHGVSADIFGDDLEMPVAAPLVEVKFDFDNNGWEMKAFPLTEDQLREVRGQESGEWEPAILSNAEYLFLNYLTSRSEAPPYSAEMISYIKSLGETPANLYKSLKRKRLITTKNNRFRYLTEQLSLLLHPNGKTYGVDLGDPLGMAWFRKYSTAGRNMGREDIEEKK